MLAVCALAFWLLHPAGDAVASASEEDRLLLDSITNRVEEVYYRPVDTRQLFSGERAGLSKAWQHAHLGHSVPSVGVPNGDLGHDNALIDHLFAATVEASASRVPSHTLALAAIGGLLEALHDPYTTYLTQSEIASLEESLRGGDFGGIGVYIVQDPRTRAILLQPIDGTPAARAGLRAGDRILSVDAQSVTGLQLDLVERLIRGHVGTIVHLRIMPRGSSQARTVPIQRQQIHVPSVKATIENRVSYIRLADFGDTSAEEMRTALRAAQSHDVLGYILDLRDNGGGLLDSAVDISSLFVSNGTIVSTIDRFGNRETKTALGGALGIRPLIILVNHYTASASEITAGAVQDTHVGTVLGTRTFGKGVVQSIYHLAEGALKVTTARYVTPAGRDIQHKGITPDVIVDQDDNVRAFDTADDRQLAAAKAMILRHNIPKHATR